MKKFKKTILLSLLISTFIFSLNVSHVKAETISNSEAVVIIELLEELGVISNEQANLIINILSVIDSDSVYSQEDVNNADQEEEEEIENTIIPRNINIKEDNPNTNNKEESNEINTKELLDSDLNKILYKNSFETPNGLEIIYYSGGANNEYAQLKIDDDIYNFSKGTKMIFDDEIIGLEDINLKKIVGGFSRNSYEGYVLVKIDEANNNKFKGSSNKNNPVILSVGDTMYAEIDSNEDIYYYKLNFDGDNSDVYVELEYSCDIPGMYLTTSIVSDVNINNFTPGNNVSRFKKNGNCEYVYMIDNVHKDDLFRVKKQNVTQDYSGNFELSFEKYHLTCDKGNRRTGNWDLCN